MSLKSSVHHDDAGNIATVRRQARGARVVALNRVSRTIFGLDPGQYLITLDPAGSGVQGQTVVGYLGESGLTVNWSVGSGIGPLASARPGIQLTSAGTANTVGTATTAIVNTSQSPCGPQKSVKGCSDGNNQGNDNCQGSLHTCRHLAAARSAASVARNSNARRNFAHRQFSQRPQP